MARILIDGRFVGVGDSQTRYVLELVRNILKLDQENQYTLLLRPVGEKELEVFSGIKGKPNLKIDILDIPHYSVAEQTKLLQYLNKKKFDLVHFTQFNHPVFYRGNYVITIQDLTLVGHLHYFNFIKQLAFNSVMKSAARDSKKIIAISKVTEKDVIAFFGTPKTKFALIYHGIDHERFNIKVKNQKTEIDAFKRKYKILDDYILYTGMWKKHKNLLRMLQAFEKFKINCPQNQTQLVLVGKIDKGEPEVVELIEKINSKSAVSSQQLAAEHINNSKQQTANRKLIITTGFIEEDELPIANAGAMAYCIPSLSEGFGWPPLEAMACGTPVISSNVSCMPEILGNAPLYFDPYNIGDIAKAMSSVTSDQKLREELSKKGLEQVKKYTWQECAYKTLEVYEEALL